MPVRLIADRAGGIRAEAGCGTRTPPDASDRLADAMRARFAGFIRRFRGPAARHLAGYLAWFGAWTKVPPSGGPLRTAA